MNTENRQDKNEPEVHAGSPTRAAVGRKPAQCLPNASRRIPMLLLAGAVVVIAISMFDPARHVLNTDLDNSNAVTYTYCAAQRLQFGKDVAHLVGPYAFIRFGWIYGGDLYWTRTVLGLASKMLVATLLVLFAVTNRKSRFVWLWLPIIVCMTLNHPAHQSLTLVLCGGLLLLGDPDGRLHRATRWLACAGIALAILSKGTLLVLGVVAIVAAVGLALYERRRRRARQIFFGALICLIVLWIAAGQNPLNLPLYFLRIVQISIGYNASNMGTPATPAELAYAFTMLGLLTGAMAWFVFIPKIRPRRCFAGLLLLAFTFIQWKHGFVRGGDAHQLLFLHWVIFLAATVWVLDSAWEESPGAGEVRVFPHLRIARRVLHRGLLIACIVMPFFTTYPPELSLVIHNRFPAGIRALLRCNQQKKDITERLNRNKKTFRLPDVQREVKDTPIDFFGVGQGILLLNDLNYHPRPTFAAADTTNHHMQKINERFVLDDARSPIYYLFHYGGTDHRLATQEDASAFNAIMYNYDPILTDRTYLLMKRKSGPTTIPRYRPLATFPFVLDRPVALPDRRPGTELFVTAKLPLNKKGRLRFFLYRPPTVMLKVQLNSGDRGHFMAMPAMLHRPVLIGTLVENNIDVLKIAAGRLQRHVTTIEFSVDPGTESYFQTDAFELTFYEGDSLESADKENALSLLRKEGFPHFSHVPSSIAVDYPESVRWDIEDDREVFFLHARAEVRFPLHGNETRVTGSFGHIKASYEGDGMTDGTEFILYHIGANGEERQLYKRRLDPFRQRQDRGAQAFDVRLPTDGTDGEFSIKFTEGPKGSRNNFDSVWISDIRIE